jgi:hypothetical protein
MGTPQKSSTPFLLGYSLSRQFLRQTRQATFLSEAVSELFLPGKKDCSNLSDLELIRYRFMLQNITDVMSDIYYQTLETNFSPENWETQGMNLVKRIVILTAVGGSGRTSGRTIQSVLGRM